MNNKIGQEKNQVINNNPIVKALSREEISRRIAEIQDSLKASTWKELETKGKFTKDDKLTFITDDMLIIGCDVGSETHYARAIDLRGRELSRNPFSFRNDSDGFQSAKQWALDLAARHQKKQIVLGLEPTGHYWFCLAAWMVSNGISVVQVNPYAVKQTKELEDNSQNKNDRKDPKLIANLVKDGNYGMPYLPEDVYAELRRLSRFKDQLSEDRIRVINRLHREMAIYFPEYKDAFGKIESAFALEVLKEAPFPEDILATGADGLRDIWRRAGLKGRGYGRPGVSAWRTAHRAAGKRPDGLPWSWAVSTGRWQISRRCCTADAAIYPLPPMYWRYVGSERTSCPGSFPKWVISAVLMTRRRSRR